MPMMFKSPSKPKLPASYPISTGGTSETADVSALDERKRILALLGRRQTILAGARGSTGLPNVSKKILTGQ